MKIKRITDEHRNDFSAVMVCEHCGAEKYNGQGYHDNYYHTQVIPAMHCGACGKNRAGELAATEQAAADSCSRIDLETGAVR